MDEKQIRKWLSETEGIVIADGIYMATSYARILDVKDQKIKELEEALSTVRAQGRQEVLGSEEIRDLVENLEHADTHVYDEHYLLKKKIKKALAAFNKKWGKE